MRDFRVFIWERFAGMEGTRGFEAVTGSDPRGPRQSADLTGETLGQPRAVSDVRLNPCAGQVLRPPAVIQARIRRCRVSVRRELDVYPRADKEYQGISGSCFT